MLGYILLFIVCAIIALCTNGKRKSTDKFVKSKTKYIRTQALPEEVGVESALPPIQAQPQHNETSTDASISSRKRSSNQSNGKKSPRVRFSKRVVVRTFEKSTREILNDDIVEMKLNDS